MTVHILDTGHGTTLDPSLAAEVPHRLQYWKDKATADSVPLHDLGGYILERQARQAGLKAHESDPVIDSLGFAPRSVTDAAVSDIPRETTTRVMPRLIERRYPSLDFVSGIPQGDEVPAVGEEVIARLSFDTKGEVARVRAGMDMPTVTAEMGGEYYSVAHYASMVEATIFEERARFQGIQNPVRRTINAQSFVHMRAYNQRIGAGDGPNLWGIATHPGIPRYISTVTWRDSGTTGQAIVEDFASALVTPSEISLGAFVPRRALVSNSLMQFLKSKTYASDGGGDRFVMNIINQQFGSAGGGQGITFSPSQSLDDLFSGYEAIFLFDDDDPESFRRQLVQAPVLLPVQDSGVCRRYIMTHTDAGQITTQPGSCLIILIPTP